MDEYIETNRDLWDGWARLHAESSFYRVDEFKAGGSVLKEVELAELPDVKGKSMLHLQCHFGLDTLSWARMGARVTGVDFSGEAIALARGLSDETGLPGRFIQSNIYDLPKVLDEAFDIVFTSYGVLCWLPDVTGWAQVAARYVREGGTFYMVEFHPILDVLSEDGERIENSYFPRSQPLSYETQGSYAVASEKVHRAFEWVHPLSEVITALVSAGLTVEHVHEFPFTVDDYWDVFEAQGPGRFGLAGRPNTLPLMYSIRAHR